MSDRKAKQYRREKRRIAIDLAAACLLTDGLEGEQYKGDAARKAAELASLSDAKFFPIAAHLAQEIERRTNPLFAQRQGDSHVT